MDKKTLAFIILDLLNEYEKQFEEEIFLLKDIINAQLEAKANSANLSYYAFTATPKPKTLEMFGILPDATKPASIENKPQAFHHYSMKQAIEEGFILDVLRGYTTYKLFYELEHKDKTKDTEVESKKAKRKISKWLTFNTSIN